MPEQRTCPGCGKLYWWPAARWQHMQCESIAIAAEARAEIATPKAKVNKLGAPVKPKFDRTTYQRELMRKRRAEAKKK